jgi:hypothetical protein
VDQGRALAVAGDDDLGCRALGGGLVEEVLHLGYAGVVGSAGEEVGG